VNAHTDTYTWYSVGVKIVEKLIGAERIQGHGPYS